ncbi:hypothetical protein WAI453_003819 [Rhynchosporium graminicola]
MRTIPEYSTCGMRLDPTHQEKVQIAVWYKAEAAIQDTPNSTRSSGRFKNLKVPAMPDATKDHLDLVASMIMVCPNSEGLPGFYPSPFQRQHRSDVSADAEYRTPVLEPVLAPSGLLPEPCVDFIINYSTWVCIKTLFLNCNPGGTINYPPFTMYSIRCLRLRIFTSRAFQQLPSAVGDFWHYPPAGYHDSKIYQV